ncbi:MAG: DUF3048 C-terminal domain-containing protein [Chloroflexota bacterium]|nr:DUF3048 C-terminal domain-containing protein [Chloroflexota bacterium]
MKKLFLYLLSMNLVFVLGLSACEPIQPVLSVGDNPSIDLENQATETHNLEPSPAPTTSPSSIPEPTSQESASETENPTTEEMEENPDVINPLTGLPAENPDYLDLSPALVSISNFPASGRPQAGLNFSPITFEMAIGEGMTRFLTMFYGQFPEAVSGQTEGEAPVTGSEEENQAENSAASDDLAASIGPIRSGRLSYEDIRATYSGFLVMASAWEGISTNLNDATSVYGSNEEDINSATVSADRLVEIARSESEGYPGSNFNLEGMTFSQTPPEGGQAADQAWIFYNNLNQVQWRYDQALDAYLRYDVKTDGSGEFVMATDRLNDQPISKENMIVIFAEHDYQAPTLIDIHLMNQPPTKALLFRDGQVYEIFWTTRFGDYEKETGLLRPMRFVDKNGDPFPLKPGQTWISIVSMQSYYVESALSEHPFHPVIEDNGTGLWLIRYKGKY